MATFLQTSGAISMSDINTVFGRGNNLDAYRGTTYYTSTTGPNTFPSGAISFNNFYGTGPSSNVVVSLASLTTPNIATYPGFFPTTGRLNFNRAGGWDFFDDTGSINNGFWVTSGATSTIGDNYWIRFTRTAVSGTNGTATATTGWQQLSSAREITVTKSNGGTLTYAGTYTIDIASDSSGTNIVATRTSIVVEADRI